MKVNYLSASRINMYLRCPQQYYFKECLGLNIPPSGAMVLGSAFHSGIEYNYRQKLYSHEDAPLEEVLDAFATYFDGNSGEAVWDEETPDQAKDSGTKILKVYHDIVSPVTQPEEVERHVQVSLVDSENNPLDWRLEGTIDLITDKKEVIDSKTTSRRTSKVHDDHVIQLSAYCLAYRIVSDGSESLAAVDYVVKKETPEIIRLPVEHMDDMIRYFLSVVPKVAAGIESELWITHREHNLCSRKWCGYWPICQQINGGRVRD